MGSRNKEDERAEKAIRSLLKLPENRRCINCNTLGPQYVCSTFWTFVCTNCSGIHREFTHRVKSVSMAKFTAEEVSALRAGGNERARQIYFEEWDTHRDGYPDGSNIFKLRDFIRSVYVDKRYTTQSNDKISSQKSAVTEDYKESKKTSASFLGSRSLHSVDKPQVERHSSAVGRSGNQSLKFYFEDKKHKQQQQVTHNNPRSRVLPKSPIRFEIVDDRFRDDGSVKRYDARKDSRGSCKSLDLSDNKDVPTFPIVRHTSELLIDSAPRLLVGDVVKVAKKKDPVNKQMTASADKMENPRSLMDDVPASSEPSDGSISQSSSDIPVSLKKTEDPAPNSLEALLFGLSVPSVVPETNNFELWSISDVSSTDNYPAANTGIQTMQGTPDSVTSFATSPTIAHAHASSSGPALPDAAANFNTEETATPSVATNHQEPSDISMEQSTLAITNYPYGVESEHHHHQDETESSIRMALPEDLFTGGFSFGPPQMYGQHHVMGYGMQYYQHPVAMGAFTHAPNPANPFDLSFDDTAPNQTLQLQFPSVACEQGGGLPYVPAPIGFSDSSSTAADSMGLMMNSQSPYYTTALSPASPSLAPNNGLGTQGNAFNGAHTFRHQANNGYLSAANPNAYISRGNPFD